MKILKPPWVNHNGYSIFSVDVHPDGTRLATGGADNKVNIWSIAPIQLQEVEEDEKVPKLLKSCEGHYSPVNSVKWSKDGKYLASGSDDKLVIVWGLSTVSLDLSIKGSTNIENWVSIHTLRGHSADISEVAWSPDNRFLATCSFDKTIIIWETMKFQMVKKLEEHSGMVKGIAWDPIGKYLSSQSDDKSVIIWRVSDWLIETKLTEPYAHSDQSFFTRLGWAPDGQFLTTPNGISDHTYVAVIIQRSNWETGSLVGHKKATVVARYSPVIYKDKKHAKEFCMMLVGGKDSALSLWSSQEPRALMITTELFTQSIQDISWFPDGYSFILCSTDGSIAYISLRPEEIQGGVPITPSEKSQFFKSIHGDAVKVAKDGTLILPSQNSSMISGMNMELNGGGNHSMFVENPDQLEMEENDKSINGGGLRSQLKTSSGPSTPTVIKFQSTQQALQNQKQTLTPTGKRRITPLHIGGNSLQSITIPSPISIPSHLQSSQESNHQTPQTSNNDNENDNGTSLEDVTMTLTSSSKITPLKEVINPFATNSSSSSNGSNLPSPKGSLTNMIQKRRLEGLNEQQQQQPSKKSKIVSSNKKRDENLPTVSNLPVINTKQSTSNNQLINGNNIGMNSTTSTIYIQPPIPVNQRSKQLSQSTLYDTNNILNSNQQGTVILDIYINEQELSDQTVEYFTVIKNFSDSTLIWENKIAGRVNLITGNRAWSSVATTESVVHVFNRSGSILMANIVLKNPISFLESNNKSHLMAITCDGYVSVWNIQKRKYEISNRELPFILNKENLTIRHAFLTEDSGKPVITFSNGDSFVYSLDVGEWIKITDRLGSLSEFNSNDTNATGILSRLQNQPTNNAPTLSNLLSISEQQLQQESLPQQQNLTTIFIEKQIWLSVILESQSEYRHWLIIYVKHLTKLGNLIKLQDLCSDLLGPSSNLIQSDQTVWESTVLGLEKRNILNEILPILASNRALQRLVSQYRESLNTFSKNYDNLLDPFK